MSLTMFFFQNFSFSFSNKNPEFTELEIKKGLDIVKKLIPLNGEIYREKLENTIFRKLDINFDDVPKMIDIFIHKNILIENSDSIISINILSNPKRQQIYSTIKQNPGICLFKLRQLLDLGGHQILYHIGALLEFQKIKFLKMNKMKIFGCMEVSRDTILLGFYMIRANIRKIIQVIFFSNAPSSLNQIIAQLDQIPESTVHYNLQMLVKRKLLKIELENEKKIYKINPKCQLAVKNFLNVNANIKSDISVRF